MASHAWKNKDGREYFYIDHGGTEEETISNIAKATDLVIKSGKMDLLILGDTTGSFGTQKVLDAVTAMGKTLKPRTKRWAVLGVTGLKKLLLKTFNAVTGGIAVPFDTEKEAFDYLFKD